MRTDTNETSADIIMEMRDAVMNGEYDDQTVEDWAGRIEAALKREKAEIEAEALAVGGIVEAERHKPGNAAAMREALERVEKLAREFAAGNYYVSDFPKMLIDAIRPALTAPPRNCDVGTAEEQTRRMDAEYCTVQKSCYESPSGRECPLHMVGVDCRLRWSQMPCSLEAWNRRTRDADHA